MQRRTALIVGIVALVVLSGVGIWLILTGSSGPSSKYGDNDVDSPHGMHFLCTNKSCGHGFTLTVKQVSEHHKDKATYGKPVKCPECKADANSANRCKACEIYYPAPHNSTAPCPRCKKSTRPQR